jgi:hypothetical protein
MHVDHQATAPPHRNRCRRATAPGAAMKAPFERRFSQLQLVVFGHLACCVGGRCEETKEPEAPRALFRLRSAKIKSRGTIAIPQPHHQPRSQVDLLVCNY